MHGLVNIVPELPAAIARMSCFVVNRTQRCKRFLGLRRAVCQRHQPLAELSPQRVPEALSRCAAARTAEQKSAAGKKAAETRKRKAEEAKGKSVKSREK